MLPTVRPSCAATTVSRAYASGGNMQFARRPPGAGGDAPRRYMGRPFRRPRAAFRPRRGRAGDDRNARPGDQPLPHLPLERAIGHFVEHYNHRRLHESLQNVTPADVYAWRQGAILERRARIKRETLARRKRDNLTAA